MREIDWTTAEDYDGPDEADWRDASCLGSRYEQQLDVRFGGWRHRLRHPGTGNQMADGAVIVDRSAAWARKHYWPAFDRRNGLET